MNLECALIGQKASDCANRRTRESFPLDLVGSRTTGIQIVVSSVESRAAEIMICPCWSVSPPRHSRRFPKKDGCNRGALFRRLQALGRAMQRIGDAYAQLQ